MDLRIVGSCIVWLTASVAFPADVYVSSLTGNDVSGQGTTAAPWKSIGRAIVAVVPGDVIHVLPGVYDLLNGEFFPIVVPAGVDLVGRGANDAIIDGAGHAWGAPQDALVRLDGSGEVSGFTFRNGPNFDWWSGSVACWNDGDVIVRNNVFQGTANRAILLFNTSATASGSATVVGNVVYGIGPADGILVFDYPVVVIAHNTVVGSTRTGYAVSEVNFPMTGVLAHNIAANNGWYGCEMNAPNVQILANCFFQNTNGTTTGAGVGPVLGSVIANPRFVDATMDDYHVVPTSPVVDKATPGAPFTDIDGQAWGFGAGEDIGADEAVWPGIYRRAPIQVLTFSAFGILGPVNETWLFAVGVAPATIPTGYGTLYFDPNFMFLLGTGTIPSTGVYVFRTFTPSDASIIGVQAIVQALVGFGPNGLTNADTFTILP